MVNQLFLLRSSYEMFEKVANSFVFASYFGILTVDENDQSKFLSS